MEAERTERAIPKMERREREYMKGRVAGLKTAQKMVMEAMTRPIKKWGTNF